MNAKQLRELGDHLFSKKAPLDSLHQEIAEAFYPERAFFTSTRSLGDDFASNLLTSYPMQARRDLGNQFGTMLRPTARSWFHPARRNVAREDSEVRGFLQAIEATQRKAMYDARSQFTRATKEGDHDMAAFGQLCISTELNKNADGLLYRCWHLKDMAWQENEEGGIGSRFRRWKPTLQQAVRLFGKERLNEKTVRQYERAPFDEMELLHMVVDADLYDAPARGRPYWSIWYDVENQAVIQENPIWTGYYRIPRWQTVSGSQYAYSPATVAALPDARLIQAMTFTLLEAGEKATSPPMIATIDAIRSDVATYANGVTWVDPEYDERMGEALRPIQQDFRGFSFGVQLNQETRAMINAAFYLNKLTMPQRTAEMTAYEVGQRVQQYIRDALPLFEPQEMEYNAGLCEDTFEIMLRNGGFGSPMNWPRKLRGADIDFHFESPLHDAIEEQKGQLLLHGEGLVAAAIKLDPSIAIVVDSKAALREALEGIGWPAGWIRPEVEVKEIEDEQKRAAQLQQLLAATQQGAAAAKDLGAAQQSFGNAGG